MLKHLMKSRLGQWSGWRQIATSASLFLVLAMASLGPVCEPADASSRKSHAANFALVSAHVRARIKAASPRKSDDEINRFLGGREAALARVSTQAAKQKGCNDPEIQQLVRRYQTQLRWRPTGT